MLEHELSSRTAKNEADTGDFSHYIQPVFTAIERKGRVKEANFWISRDCINRNIGRVRRNYCDSSL